MIAVDEAKFALDIPESPLELLTVLVSVSGHTPKRMLSDIASKGRACGCGLIFPGAITLLPVPNYVNYTADLELIYEPAKSLTQIVGKKSLNTYLQKLCRARSQFLKDEGVIRDHPFQGAFSSKRRDWDRDEMLMSVCLGIWDQVELSNPQILTKSVLQALGLFVALSRLVPDEGRQFENYIGVTSDNFQRIFIELHLQAAFICERPLGESKLISGPRIADFNARARPHEALRDLGRRIGATLRNATEDQVRLASYLAYEETPNLRSPTDGTFRDLNVSNVTAHESIAATSLKNELFFAVSEPAI